MNKARKFVDLPSADSGGGAVSIDVYVGKRIKQRRLELGMSQNDLARLLDTTWQQILKYEAADIRISCGKLYEFSRALNIPMLWFFIGAPQVDLSLDLNLRNISPADLQGIHGEL